MLHTTQVIGDAGINLMGTAGSPIMGHPIRGSSAVLGPDGRVLSAAETENEELLIAELDMELVVKTKTFADAAGHCKFLLRYHFIFLLTLRRFPTRHVVAWS